MRRNASRLLALLAVVLLVGCSGNDKQSTQQDAVHKAYLHYWQVALSAQASPGAAPDLGDVATGVQLKADQNLVQERLHAGQHVTGTYDHRPAVTSIHSRAATVRDCLTAHLTLVGPQGDQQVPAGPYAVRVTLVNTKGTWRVQKIVEDTRNCPSGASAVPSAGPTGADR
jgi:hypothetical protein